MGTENFYIIRFSVGGYEVAVLAYGDEQTVIKHFQSELNGQFIAIQISRVIANTLSELGFKAYYCFDTSIQETTIPSVMEDAVVPESEEFTTNT